MERGSIPGYYFDEDKKKYFKITANHVAPPEAKFSKSNVTREHRDKKKRKIEGEQDAKRHQQTVRPSRILEQSVSAGGIGLQRELGRPSHANDLNDRDAFFVSQLRPYFDLGRSRPRNATLMDAGTLFDTATVESTGDQILAYNSPFKGTAYFEDRTTGTWTDPIVFDSPLTSIHSFIHPGADVDVLIACMQHSRGPKVFIGDVSSRTGVYLQFNPDTSLWSSAISPATSGSRQLAISGTAAVHVIDIAAANVAHTVKLENESRAVTWLDNQTVAFSSGRKVMLYDTRSSGGSTRFVRLDTITAICSPDTNGVHLLVADNRRLDLYDTRMERTPLLRFAHVHEGPQLQMACRDSVVAAVDVDHDVQTYSLRTGRSLGKLKRLERLAKTSLLTKLKWKDIDGVPGLRCCQMGNLIHWRFGGADDGRTTAR